MLELTPEQLRWLRDILARNLPGREVRAFGSRVTGQARLYSDLDLVIMGEEGVPDQTMAELRVDLEDSDLPFRVDVVAWKSLPPALRESIARASERVMP